MARESRQLLGKIFLAMVCCVCLTVVLIEQKTSDYRSKLVAMQHFHSIFRHNLKIANGNSLSRNAFIPTERNKLEPSKTRTELDDIVITVKTGKRYHRTRADLIVKTWLQHARNQTYFITETKDSKLQKALDSHLIVGDCGKTHLRFDLCCKMKQEMDLFLIKDKKWWCHVDDDNYVHVDNLVLLLNDFDPHQEMYIGRRSIFKPLSRNFNGKREPLSFFTGGAGICITRVLVQKMRPWIRGDMFQETCKTLDMSDDTTLGFIINNRLSVDLTTSELLHSHLENLTETFNQRNLLHQVTYSYKITKNVKNIIQLNGTEALFPEEKDPTRFMSLHCLIYPQDDLCKKVRNDV